MRSRQELEELIEGEQFRRDDAEGELHRAEDDVAEAEEVLGELEEELAIVVEEETAQAEAAEDL